MTNEYIEILNLFFRLNHGFRYITNIRETRQIIINRFKLELTFLDDIICDDTNNPISVIDCNELVVTLIYNKKLNGEYNYFNLVFGQDVENMDEYKPYLRYKKIQKLQKNMNL